MSEPNEPVQSYSQPEPQPKCQLDDDLSNWHEYLISIGGFGLGRIASRAAKAPPDTVIEHLPTMTMRDIFAAHALPECIYLVSPEDDSLEPAAQLAYKLADAMLEARKQPGSPVTTQTQEKSL